MVRYLTAEGPHPTHGPKHPCTPTSEWYCKDEEPGQLYWGRETWNDGAGEKFPVKVLKSPHSPTEEELAARAAAQEAAAAEKAAADKAAAAQKAAADKAAAAQKAAAAAAAAAAEGAAES